jgi:hypothetical protein
MDVSVRFNEVLRLIGPPQNRTMMQSSGTPIVYRSFWKCGCVVDCADPFSNPPRSSVQWVSCGTHAR